MEDLIDEGAFVDLIEKFPHIWNKSSEKFKDKIALENSWQTIAAVMEITVQQCLDFWEYLRKKYVRERNKKKKIPSGSGAQIQTSWDLYNRLGFLDRVIPTRRTQGNIVKKKQITSNIIDTWEEITSQECFTPAASPLSQDSQDETTDDNELINTNNSQPSVSCSSPPYTTPNASRCNSASENQETPTLLNKLKAARNQTRIEQNSKRKKLDDPLEALVHTASTLGQNITNFLTQNVNDVKSEDYYFVLSMVESLKGIKSNKEKMLLKAKFLTQIAEVIGRQEEEDN